MSFQPIAFSAALALLATPALAADPVLYTSNPVPAYEAVQGVVKDQTGLSLGVITGGSGVLLRRIEAESSAPQADFFWSSSANTLGAFAHLFQPYAAEALSVMPDSLRYPDDLFIPTNVHVVTLLVNTDQLDGQEAPTTWAELADPAWNGRLIVADPANSSTGYTILWGLSKMLDEDTYKALVSNLVVTGAASNAHREVALGEYAVGLTFETNAYAYVDGGQEEMAIVYPEDGTFTTPEYVGLVKDAPAGDDTLRAIDALLSPESQIALLKAAFRRPSRSDVVVSDHVALPELADIKVFPVDEAEAAANRDAFLAEFGELPKAGDIE